jgi:UDP-N-acetylglucosamine 1-carboxyvinyltransferase
MMALMCLTPGISIITERIFEARFMHVSELARLGAEISIEGPSAIVKGGRPLSGAPVMASDLRASAALVIAGLAAKGASLGIRVAMTVSLRPRRPGCAFVVIAALSFASFTFNREFF